MSGSLFEQYKAALRRGHMAALAGELEEALAAYDLAARLVPDRALPLASRGTILHRLDRWPEAAEAFDRALQLAPDDEAALRARATARAERDHRSGAADDFERLAFVLDVAGRAAPAAEAASRAAELEPSTSRQALAERLRGAAAQLAELPEERPAPGAPRASRWLSDRSEASVGAPVDDAVDDSLDDPWAAALDERRLAGIEGTALADEAYAAADAALGDASAEASPDEASPEEAAPATVALASDAPDGTPAAAEDGGSPVRRPSINDSVAYDMLDALRAGMDADEAPPGAEAPAEAGGDAANPASDPPRTEFDAAGAASGEGMEGTEPAAAVDADGAGQEAGAGEGGSWPPIDLPSPPPPPLVGPPPDPEALLAEAALVLERQEVEAARDLMLLAATVHRAAGRIDAALDVCLNLLSIAPGDPRVHLAIANLQLDRGWNAVATEKLDLLVRLTSLTGDTQAEADVHGLASERLRDDPTPSTAAR